MDYSIKAAYDWIKGTQQSVSWAPWMLNRVLLRKHQLFIWLLAHGRLLTQDHLLKFGIELTNTCYLCGDKEETIDHLFFECEYNMRCKKQIEDWLAIKIPDSNPIQWWLQLRRASLSEKQCVGAVVAGLGYCIWLKRNQGRLNHCVKRPELICRFLKTMLLSRLHVYILN